MRVLIHLAILMLLAVSVTARGQEADDPGDLEENLTLEEAENPSELSAEEVAAQLANPNTSLASLTFILDYVGYDGFLPGADGAEAWRLSFQPSFPYPLGEGTNFFLRPLIPVFLDQPVPVVGDQAIPRGNPVITGSGTELGDIGFDAAIGKTFSGGLIAVGGIVATLPTATSDAVGLDQYLLGPEVLVAKITPKFTLGLLLTHQWDIAGEDSFDTSITGGQYFYTVNLKDGWQIQGTPTFSYNHEAADGQELTFPLAIGVSKTMILGGRPWKFGLQYWHYVESPDALGPEFQVRFQVTPVVPLPW